MIDRTTILTARRAYEFRPDDLRLSVLSVAQVHQQIQQFFSFQVAVVATPQQTFGPVPPAMPPGVVLDYGTTRTPEEAPTPMRFMHFEPQRVVIDVAGPSSAIDWTFEQLQSTLAEIKAPDGSPIMSEPERILDYSEISLRTSFDFTDMIDGPLVELANEMLGGEARRILPLGIKFQAADPSEEVEPGGIGVPSLSHGNLIEFRASTRPSDKHLFSVASLPTDKHVDWLEALDQHLSQA